MFEDDNKITYYETEPIYIPEESTVVNSEVRMEAEENIQIPTPQKTKIKKTKKPNRFSKIATACICAIILGALAGVSCLGVSYLGYNVFPINSSDDNKSDSKPITYNTSIPTTQVGNVVVNKDISTTVIDVSEMVDEVITSVVAIKGTQTQTINSGWGGSQHYKAQVRGSGIIIGINDKNEMLIVTNHHVVDGVDDLSVVFSDGSSVSVTVRGSKDNKDIAVLSVELGDIPKEAVYSVATLGDSSQAKVGEAAIVIGNSMGYGISVTSGIISALDKTLTVEGTEYTDLIQTDAAINGGNSGGALFNSKGEVIGISSCKVNSSVAEGMGYAISISSVKNIIDDLSIMEVRKQYSESERGYLGITGISITKDISQVYGYPVGVVINSITDDYAADKAGLKKNDIIVAINDDTVGTINELIDTLSYYKKGEKVKVTYYTVDSNGEYQKKTLELELGENPN